MSDRWLSLLDEFRHWRSSIPTGILLSFLFVSALLLKWPELARPDDWMAAELWPVASALGGVVWSLLALVGATMLGSWWCGMSTATLVFAAREMVADAPLDRRPQEWGGFVRRTQALVFPLRAIETLRSRMGATSEFHDLTQQDRGAAYRLFLREAIHPRYSALSEEPNPEVTRTWTDLRLSAGLLVPFPLALWAFPRIVANAPAGLVTLATCLAVMSASILLIETIARIRRIVELAVITQATPEVLARCSRAAIDSSRTADENQAAEDRTA